MSQKKVDQYKEQKANRKQILQKEKRILLIEKIIGGLVCAALVVWVCFSVVNKAVNRGSDKVQTIDTAINVSALDDYLGSIDSYFDEAEEVTDEEMPPEEAAAEENVEAAGENAEAAGENAETEEASDKAE